MKYPPESGFIIPFMRIFFFILLCLPQLLAAQAANDLEHYFDTYFDHKEKGDFPACASFFPEEVLQAVPGPQLEASITLTFENPAFSIRVDSGALDSISSPIMYEGTEYIPMQYSYGMTITMNPEAGFGMFDFILQSVRNTVPEKEIEADVSAGKIRVRRQTGIMLAIRKSGGPWKFMEINDQLIDIARKFIPEAVFTEI